MSAMDSTESSAPVVGAGPASGGTVRHDGWPEPLSDDALIGLAGNIVRTIEPNTEADPAALLISFLVAFGNAVGPSAHWQAEATRHGLNLFAVLVGDTAKGRKGTSWGHIERLFRSACPEWESKCIATGLSTGEGLVNRVRDRGSVKDERGRSVEDPGAADKRLFVIEPEFAQVFEQMHRRNSILSMVLRNAWDGSALECMNKTTPQRATGHHISIVGHVTQDDLLENLKQADTRNGFGNRFLWVGVRRSKKLPHGGSLSDAELAPLSAVLAQRIEGGRLASRIALDGDAGRLWEDEYGDLSEGGRGLFGSMTSRAEAQVRRIACLYALLAGSHVVAVDHLRAGLAVWRYAQQTAAYLFDGKRESAQGQDARRAEARIVAALDGKSRGMTRTEIRDALGRNARAELIDAVLSDLERRDLIQSQSDASGPNGGRPAQRWIRRPPGGFACEPRS